MTPDEELFQLLQDRAEIHGLIGQTENLHLDCKTWPVRDDDAQRILAKAFAGFANSDGGVVVIGMETKQAQKYDPDLITAEQQVADAVAVKARIESLVGDLVEPPLRGVRVASVLEQPASKAGFVLVHLPPTDGFPARSRKDWHFYIRIASGTYRMEYFQIANMFGRRHRPSLRVSVEDIGVKRTSPGVVQELMLGLRNEGRGIARFPSIRIQGGGLLVFKYGIDGKGFFGLDERPADAGSIAFGGGADHVIHPETMLKVAVLLRYGRLTAFQPDPQTTSYVFDEIKLTIEMFAEGVEAKTETITLPEFGHAVEALPGRV